MERSTDRDQDPVSRSVTVGLVNGGGSTTPLNSRLQYDPRDPFAVTAVFLVGPTSVRWTFARDLLSDGRSSPTGDGDVRVWPSRDEYGEPVVVIELSAPGGEAVVEVSAADLDAFMDQISSIVPPGSEPDLVDVDALITAIFAAEAS